MNTPACNPFHCQDPGFRRLYIFGAGGHGREVAWLVKQAWGDLIEPVFVVDDSKFLSDPVNGVRVQLLSALSQARDSRFVVAIGDPALRRSAAQACTAAGHRPALLVHPRAEMSCCVDLGDGVVICAGSIVSTNVAIGDHVHINLDCTVSHDVSIGDFTTLSPGVHVTGNVRIGRGVFIGTGANIVNGMVGEPLTIGDYSIVAAGACVTRSVEPGALVAGVPAIRKR